MQLCPVPIWDIPGAFLNYSEGLVRRYGVRIRLFEDPDFAEFTIEELIYVNAYKDLDSLVKQYVLWCDMGAFRWIPEQRVHQESIPSHDYLPDKIIREGRVDTGFDADGGGLCRFWGARRTPREPWEDV